MVLRIDRRGSSYHIYLGDAKDPILTGQWEANWFKRNLFIRNSNNEVVLTINSSFRLDFWKIKYYIQLPKQNFAGELKPVGLSKSHWVFYENANRYDYYLHRGHKKSLLKNEKQVAAYDKKYFHLFERDIFYITANDDEPIELIIFFELAFNMGGHNDESTMTLDMGNIGLGTKSLDQNWHPKKL